MLKPREREWLRKTGRPMLEGALSILIPAAIAGGLLFGLTIN